MNHLKKSAQIHVNNNICHFICILSHCASGPFGMPRFSKWDYYSFSVDPARRARSTLHLGLSVCLCVCLCVCVCVCPQRVNVIRSQLQLNISQLLVIRTSQKFKQRLQGPSRTYPNHDQGHQLQSGTSSILQTSSNAIHL